MLARPAKPSTPKLSNSFQTGTTQDDAAGAADNVRVTLGYTRAGHGAGILRGASAKAKPAKTLDRLRRDLLIPAIPSQGTSTWSHCIGLSGCPGVPGWNGPRNRSGVQIV